MPSRQIKPELASPPVRYSKLLATNSDKNRAQKGSEQAVWAVTLPMFVLLEIAWRNFFPIFFEVGIIMDILLFGLALVIAGPFHRAIGRYRLKKAVTERLGVEHAAAEENQIKIARTITVKVERIYGEQKANLLTLQELLAENSRFVRSSQTTFFRPSLYSVLGLN